MEETVAGVVANGGKVPSPAFAVGRAQEVLLLSRAMQRRRIPTVPVYADGMVRSVCGAYGSFPEAVQPALRRRIDKVGDPFFTGTPLIPIGSPSERPAVLSGPPACIVASSGMLSGGPSQYYAAELAKGAANLIALTGYQDEESPGRKLLDLADGKATEIPLGGERIRVSCGIAKYSLSAHADGQQVSGLLSALSPRAVVLVHGEGDSRPKLAQTLRGVARDGVYLPSMGQTLEFNFRGSRQHPKSRAADAEAAAERPPLS